ncbi:MAG: ATP-binding protein [Candidatus Omnitrophota bacterium]|nr:MAG: ATP-binding protein [Candidatus Omnitrophota bacterium]
MKKATREIISTEEACQLLGMSRQTLYKLSTDGKVPSRKIGARYKFVKADLMDYINGKEKKVAEEDYKVWELTGDFATAGIKKMAKRTFQELASNIEELIVNAYDGDATLVQIILDYDKRTLNIIDNGNGMDEKALANYVIYGESEKSPDYKSPKFKRVPIGEYGMGGKLAITNLCNVCKIVTRKDAKEHIFFMNRDQLNKAKYVSDIKSKVYTKKCDPKMQGTSVYMEQLSYKNIDSDRLIERFSSKMPKSQNFKITMTIVKNGDRKELEIEEPAFEYDQKFEFNEDLSLIGKAKLIIYYTKEPVPPNKQGIWTKVNGRVVNEKQEWFGLLNMTSGSRYKWRLYGYGEADGLKDFVTFSKNDFVDSLEYREYYNFVHKSLNKVQNELLKKDADARKERDRTLVKDVEKQINEIVSNLDDPQVLGNLEAKIKKEVTKEIEEAPENPYPDLDKVEEEAKKLASTVKRGKDKRERRNQNLSKSEKMTYSGKNYIINTVDLSENGDLVAFTKEKSLIEINENHQLYNRASKNGYLNNLVRDIAFTEIANDYSEGNLINFNVVFNELAKIATKKEFSL